MKLKDYREVTLCFLSLDDKKDLLTMFSTMSEEALRWGLPPYNEEWFQRLESRFENIIPLIAIYEERKSVLQPSTNTLMREGGVLVI